jgi:hypothetical protein
MGTENGTKTKSKSKTPKKDEKIIRFNIKEK